MKRIIVLLIVLLIAPLAYGATVPTNISGNTVTLDNEVETNIVTFNSTTSHIYLANLSTTQDVYADVKCINSVDRKSGFATTDTCVVLLAPAGSVTPSLVEMDISTKNLCFTTEANESEKIQVTYWVTGDYRDL